MNAQFNSEKMKLASKTLVAAIIFATTLSSASGKRDLQPIESVFTEVNSEGVRTQGAETLKQVDKWIKEKKLAPLKRFDWVDGMAAQHGLSFVVGDEALIVANCLIILRNISKSETCIAPQAKFVEIDCRSGKKSVIKDEKLAAEMSGAYYEHPSQKWALTFFFNEGMCESFVTFDNNGETKRGDPPFIIDRDNWRSEQFVGDEFHIEMTNLSVNKGSEKEPKFEPASGTFIVKKDGSFKWKERPTSKSEHSK